MKSLILVILLLLANHVHSWECPENRQSYDLRTHWHVASDVIFGRVIAGKYKEESGYDGEYDFTFKIYQTLKGQLSETVQLESSFQSLFHGMTLGQSYILFLYDYKTIDFCSVVIELDYHSTDVSDLKRLAEREDMGSHMNIRKILELIGEQP